MAAESRSTGLGGGFRLGLDLVKKSGRERDQAGGKKKALHIILLS
jgi:hypothetical protein